MGDPDIQVELPLDGTQRTVVEAAGACLARWGVTKTTVADIAAEAGCSRATIYRIFPAGKSQIMALYGLTELHGFFDEAARRVAAAPTLKSALVDLITGASQGLAEHRGFQFMLAHEPGLVLPYLGFSNIDRLYRLSTEALAGPFERFAPGRAARLVELATRITLSHALQPSATVDLCDPQDVTRLVERHLLPICAVDDPGTATNAPITDPSPLAVPA